MLTPSQGSLARAAPPTQSTMLRTPPLLASLPPWLPVNSTNTDSKSLSALSMSLAMSLHFFGYEFARGSNMALFTSSTLGFGAASGKYYPLAMACVSPASMALLLGYGRELEKKGPRKALRNTTSFCVGMLLFFGGLVRLLSLQDFGESNVILGFFGGELRLPRNFSQWVIALSFIFQNSYAHLLYAQQWSFLGSIFTPTQASQYYSYVAGLSSLCSMIAGASIDKCVSWMGLPGLLHVAAGSLVCTLLLADWAYGMAERGGFDPSEELVRKRKEKEEKKKHQQEQQVRMPSQQQQRRQQKSPAATPKNHDTNSSKQSKSSNSSSSSLLHQVKQGYTLFKRVPTLGALFLETLTFQSLSTILNTILVTQLKQAVPDDGQRAAWTGNFYATVNGLSTVFQFFLFPFLTRKVEPKVIWRLMPLLPLFCTLVQCASSLDGGSGVLSFLPSALTSKPSAALYLIAVSFLTAKTMDYSLRNVLAELVYVPLDFESRFVGKEVIAVFANRFGKSGMALILSGWQFLRRGIGVGVGSAAFTGGSGGGGGLLGIALMASLGWWGSALRLSSLVLGKEEAEKVVAERMRLGGDEGINDDNKRRRQKEE
mmetsp:Transcript_20874/g.42737  ORF Transcript_20874/g.42737 Transcript_20874/m.42737 type:complete len:599 (-) Transcript_20874:108-1904(-)